MSSAPEDFSPNIQQVNLLLGIQQFYHNKQLSDVTLVVNNKEFPCNRIILAASSPYFRAMFTSNVQESQQSRVVLYDIFEESLEKVLSYMYTGRISIRNENVQDLYILANQLELLHVLNLCIDHMINEICIYNCLDLYNFAVVHYNERLKLESVAFIIEHFTEVCGLEDFGSKVDGHFLETLISHDNLDVEREEIVFEAIMVWLRHDLHEREHMLPNLFKLVRLPLLDKQYYENKVIKNSLIKGNSFCKNLLTAFRSYENRLRNKDEHVDTKNEMEICDRLRLGMYTKTLIVFSGGAYGKDERSLSGFDPITRKNYYSVKPHPNFDYKFKIDLFKLVTLMERELYFIGGIFYENHHFEDSGPALSDVFYYDQKAVKWVKRKPMIYPRCAFAACADGENIYVSGGKPSYPGGDALDSMEVYDSSSDYWSLLDHLPLRLYHHAAAVCQGGIFIFGGKDIMDAISDTVLRFDIKTKNWAIVKNNLTKPREQMNALTVADKIYILGGSHTCENALSVEIYDPTTNRFRFGSDFPDERKFTAVTVIGDIIYVCGGTRLFGRPGRRTRHVETRDLYSYNVRTNTWTKCVKMVQYANPYACASVTLNLKYLKESDFISNGDS